MKKSAALLAGVAFVCLVTLGFGVTSYAKNDTMTEPVKMTSEQMQELNRTTQFIHTYDGLFERTGSDIAVASDEVAYDTTKVTSKTKKLVLPYGTFVKTKSFENGQEIK